MNLRGTTVLARLLLVTTLAAGVPLPACARTAEKLPPPRAAADPLDGPPYVTAKAWAVADGATGKLLWGSGEAQARPIASTTKVMTAHLVLRLAAGDAKALDEVVTFSERAAATRGSSSRLRAGDRLPVRELLYGLLLPSGNDAATALAEHFGVRFESKPGDDALARFVAEMNRRAAALGMAETAYLDPHGLGKNLSSARDLARLTAEAMRDGRFRDYVQARRRRCEVVGKDGEKREVAWENTNRLLGVEGYDGVKTGTTTPAGSCLVASGRRGDDHLLVVILGGASNDGRYADARNLFRWAWLRRGHGAR
jgi:serine-type D-Ala-D-Ala carboxypeptidase (penicillin-binding protein 5/6)